LRELLRSSHIASDALLTVADRSTTVKRRIISGHQQMLRLDRETRSPLAAADEARLYTATLAQLDSASLIIISDYGKGVVTRGLCSAIVERARARHIPVLVDPKGRDFTKYVGATGVSPNRAELAAVTLVDSDNLESLYLQGEALRARLGFDFIALTQGELGIALLEPGRISKFPTIAREVFDVSGAGDTVIAVLGAAMSANLHLHDAVQLANLAAGIVIGKVGTSAVNREELLAGLEQYNRLGTGKLALADEIVRRVNAWRQAGDRVVFTNGCFDILHVGHVSLLEYAKHQGNRLVVGLNSDSSVRRLKGINRPVAGEQERARVLAALSSVDAVVLFDDDTPLSLINSIRPEVLVKGGDYNESEIVGAPQVRSWGGRVAIFPLVNGFSTTAMLKKASQPG
jgi:D-beta-D-heptose 7-phosphate kinase/D-beta-D-heptose 1-phosphate adenosyltransferase